MLKRNKSTLEQKMPIQNQRKKFQIWSTDSNASFKIVTKVTNLLLTWKSTSKVFILEFLINATFVGKVLTKKAITKSTWGMYTTFKKLKRATLEWKMSCQNPKKILATNSNVNTSTAMKVLRICLAFLTISKVFMKDFQSRNALYIVYFYML